jgi:p-aminobenzoyl-glutamate transporter AbgT
MPPIDSAVLALMASIATIFVQLIKGLLSDDFKQWIPLMLFVVMIPLGIALAMVYGRDPIAGALEGFFGFASAVGFYEAANSIPVVNKLFSSKGWVVKGQ